MEVLYSHDKKVHNTVAPREVVPLIMDLVAPESVIDVGCGLGTWLAVFEEAGVTDVLGVDGDYVPRSELSISQEKFVAADLTRPFGLSRKFDLVVSLEVAEHLPERAADTFVHTLVSLGDTILFSAAIPGQDGQNHLNEQWPEYWQEKFSAHGYRFYDVVREKIWNNDKVDVWYRQNIFLISTRSFPHTQGNKMLSCVHPDLFKLKVDTLAGLEPFKQRVDEFEQGKVGVQIGFDVLKKAVQRKINS